MTNGEMEDSKISYKELLMDGIKIPPSVYVFSKKPFRTATICLSVLCVVLVVGIISQGVYYQKVKQDHQDNIKAMDKEKDNLQENLKRVQKEKTNLETNLNQLQQNNNVLSRKTDQIQANNNLLTEQINTLKLSESQLKTSNAALNKELEQLKASNGQLEASKNAFLKAKNTLETNYNLVMTRKRELQTSYDSVIKDRDNLQNKYNNVTRLKEQLQNKYNILIKVVEHLHESYNFSTIEKAKIADSHQNLTLEKEILQTSFNVLKNATDELQAVYNSLIQEKKEIERSCKNATEERDLLKMKNFNLTTERDYLFLETQRLNATIQDKRCPTGWKKLQNSCYYSSTTDPQKSWKLSRKYCQDRNADLAIIDSQEEMDFINTMFDSNIEVWIGLTDNSVEGRWKWVDGTPLTTAFWGSGQPNSYNGKNQDCAEFRYRVNKPGDWNDESCETQQNWICEM
ncbi:hypothetical protein PAMA_015923 [Pampus argenteus]